MKRLLLLLAMVGFMVSLQANPVLAHRSGCHRWHSCPSDSGSYTCGDTGHSNYCGTTPTPQITTPVVTPTPSPDTSTSPTPTYTPSSTVSENTPEKSSSNGWWWIAVPAGLWGASAISDKSTKRSPPTGNASSSYTTTAKSVASSVCPRCGGRLILRNGKRGLFYGCSNFKSRSCRFTKNYTSSL